jgi:hypothetical protein
MKDTGKKGGWEVITREQRDEVGGVCMRLCWCVSVRFGCAVCVRLCACVWVCVRTCA